MRAKINVIAKINCYFSIVLFY